MVSFNLAFGFDFGNINFRGFGTMNYILPLFFNKKNIAMAVPTPKAVGSKSSLTIKYYGGCFI